jgi:hypothetical protein
MTLAPQVATLAMTCDGTTVLGVRDFKITEKTTMKEITCDANTSIGRFPTVFDADFTATLIEDPADAGQDKIRASKPAKTLLQYVCAKGTTVSTLSAYVESLNRPSGPSDEQVLEVTFAVSGGCSSVTS